RGEPEVPLLPVRSQHIVEQESDLSTILDASFGTTPGQFLLRGVAGWQAGAGGAGTGTVTQIVASAGLSGGTINTAGSIGIANSTPNTLAGFNASGNFSGVTITTTGTGAATLSGGVLNIPVSSGGGSGINPSSPGQVALFAT